MLIVRYKIGSIKKNWKQLLLLDVISIIKTRGLFGYVRINNQYKYREYSVSGWYMPPSDSYFWYKERMTDRPVQTSSWHDWEASNCLWATARSIEGAVSAAKTFSHISGILQTQEFHRSVFSRRRVRTWVSWRRPISWSSLCSICIGSGDRGTPRRTPIASR